ncbi:MAG TPA: AAA family ATPase [Candidatus Saccharimonadales bacterium]|nr:AAA family ATPase [Candidatus Saccharimonadales bacterium]
MKLIGIAGSLASGKDSLAQYLVDNYEFCHVSTGDLVREIAQQKYGSIERPVLYKTANELREEKGSGVLGKMSLEYYQKHKDKYPGGLIVSGFRALAEAQAVKDAGGIIIYIDAPLEKRYMWMQGRGRDKEATVSLEEFKKRESNENGGVDPAFDISAIKNIADAVIQNDSTFDSFLQKFLKASGL